MAEIPITRSIALYDDELHESFVRSSGPGGQNVNKVATAVQLRFDVRQSPNLPERVREKILTSGDSRLTKDGVLVILAERHRTQEMNRKDARDRLFDLIRKAAHVPKRRIATKPTLGSKKRRLESKTKRGAVKKARSGKISLD
ncbi:MAG: aminoacyl-tRNA hydrolase [Rhizobiales bacterium]|nr:aminoacyl-tRNA hydrolase [Hyphomicrobiales bacterium]MBO6699265.1 aminoacyl-tRNA hydrolase [Hyphomicrobiales bacterium]MBO6736803.1 aminoacyl-tRNA hydrolase [Hyphomicrobiales bacterium]MBO6912123.1 aminoacyl-tRNA hydrolase [Hyphomicrobiales bacterium]MBO6954509.1 aminoacyl-tRNA hydrolase [Hyphomicrobiales bacterium]